ncbi:helix-turn-helix transcriptional regulator [Actinoplanes sp. HUAS TT8]|uniref:helix-turn-helix transcriptional regulator n=1 Tax=Actinoplanes sp. HUAS TT8 TaxID=3447453 RepID=UPI003F522A46
MDVHLKPMLMGSREIAERLGLCRQRIQQLADRPDFPAPYQELRMGRVWWRSDVETWIRGRHSGGTTDEPGDDVARELAERLADHLAYRNLIFIENDQIEALARTLRLLLGAAGVETSEGPSIPLLDFGDE